MKIHEYQGKEIFRKYGMPTPRGIPAFTADEAVRANLAEQGLEAYRDSTPERTRRFVEEDTARWTPIIRGIGLKFN